MSNKYRVRIYASTDQDDCVEPGTVVGIIDRCFTVYAYTAEEVEETLRKNVLARKLEAGRVYQICPAVGNPEVARTLAVSLDNVFTRVFLDPAMGLYSEFRRIRRAQTNIIPEPVVLEYSLQLR